MGKEEATKKKVESNEEGSRAQDGLLALRYRLLISNPPCRRIGSLSLVLVSGRLLSYRARLIATLAQPLSSNILLFAFLLFLFSLFCFSSIFSWSPLILVRASLLDAVQEF